MLTARPEPDRFDNCILIVWHFDNKRTKPQLHLPFWWYTTIRYLHPRFPVELTGTLIGSVTQNVSRARLPVLLCIVGLKVYVIYAIQIKMSHAIHRKGILTNQNYVLPCQSNVSWLFFCDNTMKISFTHYRRCLHESSPFLSGYVDNKKGLRT